ncbi:MAG: glycoside-pentoside-hexuronide (GPH):cation symporter [Anaerolineales bacterium]|nr:glycoside-pentoside-hexuronide (GPH):cation symporter [Anaerolineales bacterium]
MEQKLSAGFKFRFALADLGFMTLRSFADFFLLFYLTDVAGVNPAIAGSALLFGKLTWDAFNDPLFGYWSDRTRSRFGRRRIYLLVTAIPLALVTWLQFSLPTGLTGISAFLAVLFTFWLKDTCVTLAIVPYYAMTAEVTRDYRERSNIVLYRGLASVVGYILGAAVITTVVGVFKGVGMNLQHAWSTAAALYGSIAMVTLLITALSIRENPELAGELSSIPPLKGIMLCFNNKPFVLLMIVFLLGSFAFTAQSALLPYLIQYQLGMAEQTSTILTLSLLTMALFLYPAKLLADRINKGPTYALGMLTVSVTLLLAFAFLPAHPSPLIYVVAVLLGIGFSTQWVIPNAMLPDVIEYDQKMTGERREGTYNGISNFMSKFSVALGIAVPSWALNWFGYIPNAAQTEQALFGIRFFYAVLPSIALLACLPILFRYPITRQMHDQLRQELAAKHNLEVTK